MNSKKILTIGFVIMVFIQLAIPIKMIWDKESTTKNGKTYYFKVAPIDPYDPFRGRYIDLNIEENSFVVADADDLQEHKKAYATITNDDAGLAQIEALSAEPPTTDNYVKVDLDIVKEMEGYRVFVRYPFSKYYMEETKAPAAEKVVIQQLQDSTSVITAQVVINKGDAVLQDVQINQKSIHEWLR